MATYDEELIRAARRLTARRTGQKGKLPSARVRRSISTSYYALFHFLVEEACLSLVGRTNDLRRRRRALARIFTHAGIKTALEKVRGPNVDSSIADLMRPGGGVPRAPCDQRVESIPHEWRPRLQARSRPSHDTEGQAAKRRRLSGHKGTDDYRRSRERLYKRQLRCPSPGALGWTARAWTGPASSSLSTEFTIR